MKKQKILTDKQADRIIKKGAAKWTDDELRQLLRWLFGDELNKE